MNRIADQEVGVKARGFEGLNKYVIVLKDIQVKDKGAMHSQMLHAKIVDNNLVLELDYGENPRLAILSYLQLAGYDMKVIAAEKLIDKVLNNQNIP